MKGLRNKRREAKKKTGGGNVHHEPVIKLEIRVALHDYCTGLSKRRKSPKNRRKNGGSESERK